MDISRALELVNKEVLTILAEPPPAVAPVWRELVEVQTIPGDGSFTGEKITNITGQGDLLEVAPGQPYPEDEFKSAFTRYGSPRHFGRRLAMDEGQIAALLAAGKLGDYQGNRVRSFRLAWEDKKHQTIARVYNKGSLSAGDAVAFDGSNKEAGLVDPYPEFIYDGKPLFSTAHPLGSVGGTPTVANLVVSAALSSTTLAAALTAFKKDMAVSERNQRFTHLPDVLLVPTELEVTAAELINSTLKPGVSTNEANALKGVLRPVSWSYLDDADGWFVARAKHGIKAYDSGDLRVRVWYDQDRKRIVIDVDGYFGALVTDWRHARAHNKATS